ncbi:DUF3572 family protein [Aureimonas leprariae]|uniref:DUF3572 family protein n=1 Tax=Plantimonas leprariae TaxID=2615207 RepID=A0A7V7PRH4_9HYPH|nr:DUF3572 family protein [Aureimonas leprariae]KAB0681312.1 DUF3572 family protein [Aureimonas leprariae]
MTVLAFPKPSSRAAVSIDEGERLGIDALAFVASRDELVRRFLDVTGLEAGQIRTEAQKPTFLVGVLDFLLANENDVIEFAGVVNRAPREIGPLRNTLAVSVGMPGENYPS